MLLPAAAPDDKQKIIADTGVPYSIPGKGPFNAPYPMPFTVDSGNPEQSCHPSVVDFGPGKSFGGYRYWMGITDYGGKHNGENPQILCSNDPYNFAWPPGVTNPLWTVKTIYEVHTDMQPIHPDPGYQWNSDTELVFDEDTQKLVLFWREMDDSANGGRERLWCTKSSDGRTWSNPELIQEFYREVANGLSILCPCIVKVASGDWRMITWGIGASMRKAPSMYGPWGSPTPLVGQNAWHACVYYKNGVFYALGGAPACAYISYDGVNWQKKNVALDKVYPYERGGMYRPFMTPHEDGEGFRVWYGTQWPFHTAYTVLPRSLWGEG